MVDAFRQADDIIANKEKIVSLKEIRADESSDMMRG